MSSDGKQCWTGGDSAVYSTGSKVMKFLPGGNFNAGLYFRYVGLQPEPILPSYGYITTKNAGNSISLPTGNYVVKYSYVGWESRDSCVPFTFHVSTGENILFSASDTTSRFTLNGSANKQVTTAKDARYYFSIAEPCNVDLTWSVYKTWGGVVLGNVSVESISNSIELYSSEFNQAVLDAHQVLDSNNVEVNHRYNLLKSLQNYANMPPATVDEYLLAIDNLKSLTSKYRMSITYYHRFQVALQNLRETVALYQNTALTNTVFYQEILDYLNDTDPAVRGLDFDYNVNTKIASDYATGLIQFSTVGVNTLSRRLNRLIYGATMLGINTDAYVVDQQAIDDNDEKSGVLKAIICDTLQTRLQQHRVQFTYRDENGISLDSVDMTGFIKNPNFYTMQRSNGLSNSTFPGWTTNVSYQNTGLPAQALNSAPVVDTYAFAYNVPVDYFEQQITGLPKGTYNITMRTRAADPKTMDSLLVGDLNLDDKIYFYAVTDSGTLKVPFQLTKSGNIVLAPQPSVLRNVKVSGGNLKIGIHVDSIPGYVAHALWGDPTLYLVAEFDSLQTVIPVDTGEVVVPDPEPVVKTSMSLNDNGSYVIGDAVVSDIRVADLTDNGVIAYQFNYVFNPDVLEYQGYTKSGTLSDGGVLVVNEYYPGWLKCSYMNTTALAGDGSLLKLNFKAKAAGESYNRLDSCLLNTTSVDSLTSTIITVLDPVTLGDVDGNSHIQAYDAALALQYSVGLIPAADWSLTKFRSANVDGDSIVSANDAGLILRYSANLISGFPADNMVAIRANTVFDAVKSPVQVSAQSAGLADVSVTREENRLVFRSIGSLIGLNVKVKNGQQALGAPTVLNNNMLVAKNISDETYKLGLATAYAPQNNEVFMTIPILDNASDLELELMVNTTSKTVKPAMSTGISSNLVQHLQVYPNPVKSQLLVRGIQKGATVILSDLNGRMLKQLTSNDSEAVMEVGSLAKGLYLLKVVGSDTVEQTKIVKE